MIQTVSRSHDFQGLLDGYGLVLVDGCHQMPAPTVERAIRTIETRRWVGLTARPQRPDRLSRSELLALITATLIDDMDRDRQICQDIADATGRGRNCLALTERTEHVEWLTAELRRHGFDPMVLYGSLTTSQRNAVHGQIEQDDRLLLLVATDRYIGEGFDCPRLDPLFLTFPIPAKQRIVQYVGRILRTQPAKHAVEMHDYLDSQVPVLAAMYRRRVLGDTPFGFAPTLEAAPTGSLPSPRRRRAGRRLQTRRTPPPSQLLAPRRFALGRGTPATSSRHGAGSAPTSCRPTSKHTANTDRPVSRPTAHPGATRNPKREQLQVLHLPFRRERWPPSCRLATSNSHQSCWTRSCRLRLSVSSVSTGTRSR